MKNKKDPLLPTQKPQERTLQQKSLRGVKWQISTEVVARAFRLLTMFVLAHILLPADFGLIGMALIFTQLAFVLFDMGLSVPLIQKKNLQAIHYQTTFSVLLVLSVTFYGLVFVLAPLVARFFKNEALIPILRWLSTVFFFYALRGIATVRLQKQLRFRALGVLQLTAAFVYAVLAIWMAKRGGGVWSFVVAIIGQEFVLTLTSLLVLKEWYRPKFSRPALAELSGFGGTVFLTRITNYLNVNLPNMVIGRWLGETALGFYSVGYQLVDFPVQRISKNILRVMFPAFSKVQDDSEAFKSLYKDTLRGLLLAIIPVFSGMVLVAPEFVQIFYGAHWSPLISILQVLAIVGVTRSIWTLTSVVFLARGRPVTELLVNLAYFVALSFVLVLTLSQGLFAVVWGVAAVLFCLMLVFLMFSLRVIGLSLRQWLQSARTPFLGSFLMALVLLILRFFVITPLLPIVRLGLMVVLGAVAYLTGIIWLEPGLKSYFKKFLKRETGP